MERYTPLQVARLLSNFHVINGVLFGKAVEGSDTYLISVESVPRKHASNPVNGKERARKKEELLCMMLDLEEGLKKVHPTVRRVLLDHFVYETHVLERERRGYLASCLRKLANVINNDR